MLNEHAIISFHPCRVECQLSAYPLLHSTKMAQAKHASQTQCNTHWGSQEKIWYAD